MPRASAVLDNLLADHENLGRLVALLDRQPSLQASAMSPNIGLLVDVLFYLTRFPDVMHHPLEDRIVERLLARGALDPQLGAELEAQHARIARQGQDLMRDLEGAVREESMSTDLLATNIRLYAERLRHNIAFEELALFPVASRALQPEDWEAIAASTGPDSPDPLFDAQVQDRFVGLHRAIAQEANCGCEVPAL